MRNPTSRLGCVCGVISVLCLSGLARAQDFVPVTDQSLHEPAIKPERSERINRACVRVDLRNMHNR